VLDPSVPASVHALLLSFSGCFNQPSFGSFVALVTGWVSCPGRHSISRVIQAASSAAKGKHHSSFYRFLSEGAWAANSVAKVIFRLLLPFLSSQITVLVDDTLCHKSGPHLFGANMHFDSARSTYGRGTSADRKSFFAFGHNWVVLALWIPLPWRNKGGIAVPFLFRLYRSKKYCPQKQHRKRTELAAEMIDMLAGWVPDTHWLEIVGDSEYACRTLVRDLPSSQHFTGPMTMDAAVYDEPGEYQGRGRTRLKGTRLSSPQDFARCKSTPWEELELTIYGRRVTVLVKSRVCLWYTVAGTRKVRMVVTRDPTGRIDERAYFSTDADRSVAETLEQFSKRWEIEVAFRNCKQSLGLEDPQNGWWRRKSGSPRPKKVAGPNPKGRRGEKAVNHTLAVAFVTHALVVLWYLMHGEPAQDVERAKKEAPWYSHKRTPSFSDMLTAMRLEIWAARFSAHPDLKGVSAKTREILPGWLLAA